MKGFTIALLSASLLPSLASGQTRVMDPKESDVFMEKLSSQSLAGKPQVEPQTLQGVGTTTRTETELSSPNRVPRAVLPAPSTPAIQRTKLFVSKVVRDASNKVLYQYPVPTVVRAP